jgi:hypothetical protein
MHERERAIRAIAVSAHLLAVGVLEGEELQRAVALQRARQVPHRAVHLGDHRLLGQALGDGVGHVQGGGDAPDARLLGAVGQDDGDRDGLGLGRLARRVLARLDLGEQVHAVLVVGLLLLHDVLPGPHLRGLRRRAVDGAVDGQRAHRRGGISDRGGLPAATVGTHLIWCFEF